MIPAMAAAREPVARAQFPPACGVYVVWEPGDAGRPLYVGGAVTHTIEERWRRNHLRLSAGVSALRRALGVHLGLVEQRLNPRTDGRFYAPEVERRISEFLHSCEVAFLVADSPEQARELERQTIRELRPLLNGRARGSSSDTVPA